MTEIDRLLRRASLRLALLRVARALVALLSVAVGLLVLARLGERFFALPVDWTLAWSIAGGGVVLGAIVWVVVGRPGRLEVAREIDERAGLRESIGTALCVDGLDDGWSRATVEHARGMSRRVVVRQVFPLTLHRSWPVPLVGAVLFVLLGLVPQTDVLGLLKRAEATETTREAVESAREEVEAVEEEVREALEAVDDPALLAALEDEPEPGATPEEIRRHTMKKLTTLQDRLDELQGTDEMRGMEKLRDRLKDLRQPEGLGDLDSMVKALQAGDFQAASKAMEALARKMAQADLTPEQRAALAKQLEALAGQLAEMAQQRDALAAELERLGLDAALASNPEALAKALESMSNLTPEQKDALMKQCKACSNASKMCQGMAGACKSAAASMMQGKQGAQGMDQLGSQLSALEAMQQQMSSMNACRGSLDRAMAGMGQGGGGSNMLDIYKRLEPPSGSGMSMSRGNNAPGGRKAGHGTANNEAGPTPDFQADLDPTKADTSMGADPVIIGRTLVEGAQVRGEAAAEFREAVSASSEAASEAIETKVIPREYHEAIKRYFGKLQEEADDATATEDQPETDEPSEG